jgi:hypothetical protein
LSLCLYIYIYIHISAYTRCVYIYTHQCVYAYNIHTALAANDQSICSWSLLSCSISMTRTKRVLIMKNADTARSLRFFRLFESFCSFCKHEQFTFLNMPLTSTLCVILCRKVMLRDVMHSVMAETDRNLIAPVRAGSLLADWSGVMPSRDDES